MVARPWPGAKTVGGDQSQLARLVTDRKIRTHASIEPPVVAASNLGKNEKEVRHGDIGERIVEMSIRLLLFRALGDACNAPQTNVA